MPIPVDGRRQCRRESGAVAVEFALVSPLLIALLFGIISVGWSYTHALGITNAVREGARFGTTADATSASWTTDVISRVRATQFDDPTSETSICVEFWNGPTRKLVDCPAGGPGVTASDLARYPIPPGLLTGVCVVRVVAARNFVISAPPLLPSLGTSKMVRGAVARYEQKTC